jgi:hypothetical protein
VLGFSLTLCRYVASLLEHPVVPVSVGCWFFLGTVNPTWAVQESIKLARSVFIPFIGFSFLPGFRSGEPCVNRGVFSIASAIFIPALIFIALWLSIGVASFRGACIAGVSTLGEPAIFSRAKAGHQRGQGCHSPRFILSELSSQPFISDIIFECGDGLGFGTIYNLVLLGEEPILEFSG